MSDLICRQAAISAICNACGKIDCDKMDKCEKLQLSPANISETPNSSDTISREQAIKATWQDTGYTDPFNVMTAIRDRIKQLPPIHPVNNSEMPNSSDVISRQAAIDALDEQIEQCNKSLSSFDISMKDEYAVKVERASLVAFRETLEYLPSAEPKRGKWIYGEDSIADGVDGYRCDQCGFFVPWDYTHKSIDYIKDYNFCPKCGSYNGGEQDG